MYSSLRRGDHSHRGFLPSVMCLSVIVKQLGGPGPLGGYYYYYYYYHHHHHHHHHHLLQLSFRSVAVVLTLVKNENKYT